MRLVLNIWRQACAAEPGAFVRYTLEHVAPESTLLEALDQLNEQLVHAGEIPVAFESDCREGICGACGVVVAGHAHGGQPRTATCELRLSAFRDGAELSIEPYRARAFPIVRDLVVERSALDRVMGAGGYVSVRTSSAPEANALPIGKERAEHALDAAACIGCGACAAACPNASAALFIGAKVTHLALLPQGAPERTRRARRMLEAADREGFGACSSHGNCHAVCPKGIEFGVIARLNREILRPSPA